MAELMNRCRGLAEGVVVMICPVLLALNLNMVNLNAGDLYGHFACITTLAMAGVTLITGICPLLCCFFEGFFGLNGIPATVNAGLVAISSACHLVLTCLIAQLLVPKPIAITVGVVIGTNILSRTVRHYHSQNASGYTQEMHKILDESHEFLTSITGIIFLGLEGLALEGDHSQLVQKGGDVRTISFVLCASGVALMFVEMTPPTCFSTSKHIVGLTLKLDCAMAAGTLTLLLAVISKFMNGHVIAMLLFVPPVLGLYQLVAVVVLKGNTQQDEEDEEESSPAASMELTAVTFTGFFVVSVTASSNGSPSNWTVYFLLLSALAIVFGLTWRLLSQKNTRSGLDHYASSDHVASTEEVASFFAHLCIVIATILFVVDLMAGKATRK